MQVTNVLKYFTATGLVAVVLSSLSLIYHSIFSPPGSSFFILMAFIIGVGIAIMIPKRIRAWWLYQKVLWLLAMILVTTICSVAFWIHVVPIMGQETEYLCAVDYLTHSKDILFYSFGLGFSYIFYMEIVEIWKF
jgi:hypothetical protein